MQSTSPDNPITVFSDDARDPAEIAGRPRTPIYVILDNLRSALNVGCILRTCDSALIAKVYLCGITAHPPNKKLAKTSLGASDVVPWEHFWDPLDAIVAMRARGIPIFSVEVTDQSLNHTDFTFPRPVCVVFGNEVDGVSKDVLRSSDQIIQIPMCGLKNSLNVAVAHGIIVHEILRQYRLAGAGERP